MPIFRPDLIDLLFEKLAVIIVNMESGEILLASQAAETMFGPFPVRGEMVGQAIETLIPAEHREAHVGHRARFVADPHERTMGAGLVLRGLRRDGGVFPVEIMLYPSMFDRQRCAVAVVFDMTTRHRAQAGS